MPKKPKKSDILGYVEYANPGRSWTNIERRIAKLGEEFGELCEAVLGVTSDHNYKNKCCNDVREEAVDVAICALCIALTRMPSDKKQINTRHEVERWFDAKLKRWMKRINAK